MQACVVPKPVASEPRVPDRRGIGTTFLGLLIFVLLCVSAGALSACGGPDDDKPKSAARDTSSSSSGAETPEPAAVELPTGAVTMDVQPAPDQQQGVFDAAFAPLITARVNAGNLGDHSNDDLAGLTGGQRVDGLVDLAHRTATSLAGTREKLSGSKYANSGLAMQSTLVRTMPHGAKSFTTVVDIEYLLIDDDGMPVGHVFDNTERFGFTYKPLRIRIENGEAKEAMVLTDVEDLNSNSDK